MSTVQAVKRALLVLSFLLAACAGSSSGGDDTPPTVTTQAHSNAPHRVMHYLQQNFQGTTWLEDVKSARMRGGDLYLRTDLYPDSDANYPAQAICGSLRFLKHLPDVHLVSTTGKWIGC